MNIRLYNIDQVNDILIKHCTRKLRIFFTCCYSLCDVMFCQIPPIIKTWRSPWGGDASATRAIWAEPLDDLLFVQGVSCPCRYRKPPICTSGLPFLQRTSCWLRGLLILQGGLLLIQKVSGSQVYGGLPMYVGSSCPETVSCQRESRESFLPEGSTSSCSDRASCAEGDYFPEGASRP